MYISPAKFFLRRLAKLGLLLARTSAILAAKQ